MKCGSGRLSGRSVFEPAVQSVMSVCLRRTVRVASPVAFSAVRNAMRVPVMGARSYSIPPDSQDGPIDDSFIPARLDRSHETPDVTRARLIYQSRKRGILETDLVLSTFADKYLPTMSPEELKEYDEVMEPLTFTLLRSAARRTGLGDILLGYREDRYSTRMEE